MISKDESDVSLDTSDLLHPPDHELSY